MLTDILKEAVHRVQHLVGEVEEPFPCWITIVQTLLSLEHNMQTLTKVLGLEAHDLHKGEEEGGGEERGVR